MSIARCPYCRDFNEPEARGNGIVRCPSCQQLFDGAKAWPRPNGRVKRMSNTDHLAKAKDYIAKGEDYYRKAADEILAAQREDPTLSYRAIAGRIGKSESWVGKLVRSRTNAPAAESFEVDWERVGRPRQVSAAKQALREGDDSTMQEIVAALPEEQRTKLVHAAVNVPRPASDDREGERGILQSIKDAPKHDLSAQAAKLVLVASQIELLLADGAEFQRMDAKNLQRLDRDLGRVKDTAERLQEQIGAQGRVRRIA